VKIIRLFAWRGGRGGRGGNRFLPLAEKAEGSLVTEKGDQREKLAQESLLMGAGQATAAI